MKTMNVTVKQFSQMVNSKSPVEANSVMNFLKSKGQAIVVGKKPPASGKGKHSVIYQIPQTINALELFKDSDMKNSITSETVESKATESETIESKATEMV